MVSPIIVGLTSVWMLGSRYGMSWPHFLYDHPHYRKKMRGISDGIEENHETYIDIQPDTGIPLRIVRRSQVRSVHIVWFHVVIPR